MENKYYIPSIEEFREGFLYELKMGNNWYPMNSPFYPLVSNSGLEYRVKYLDREDIESFGFKFYAEGRMSVSYLYEDYFITFYNNRHLLINKSSGMGQVDNKLFSGKIKNKSELQQVLKMIGVIE